MYFWIYKITILTPIKIRLRMRLELSFQKMNRLKIVFLKNYNGVLFVKMQNFKG
jgi:hypothetical protein